MEINIDMAVSGPQTRHPQPIKTMKKIFATLLIFSAIGLGVIAFGAGGGSVPRPNANADAFNRGPDVDQSSAVVQLKGDPVSTNPSNRSRNTAEKLISRARE